MMRIATVAAVALLSVTMNAQAVAQEGRICAARGEALAYLSNKYSEAPVAMGLTNKGAVVEVLTNQNGTTWTIIVTMPNGVSCMIAAGEGWEAIRQVATGPENGGAIIPH